MAKDPKKYSAEELKQMKGRLDSDRQTLSSTFDAALFYYLPEFQSESEYRNNTKVSEENQPLQPIGQEAAAALAAGIYSNTVNMGSEFFGFRTNDEELNKSEAVKRWFSDASKACMRQMQNSNFAMATHETILSYVSLCTGVMYSEYDGDSMVYQNFPITQCSISENKDGIVNTLFRSFEMTAQQAMEKWGDKNSEDIQKAYADSAKRFMKFPFFHAVMPRLDTDNEKLTKDNKPFYSYYCDEHSSHIVEDGGYDSFPYAVPRFLKTSTSVYGRGPAFSCLGLCREIDRLEFVLGDATELKANPPSFFPAGTVQEDIDLLPGGVNFYNPSQGNIVFYQTDVDLKGGMQRQFGLIEHVKKLFYADLFRMMDEQKNMTATEVNARLGEKVQAITPVVNRLYDEFFEVTLTRTLQLLVSNGVIPDYPEEIQGKDYTVEYTTKLDSMMKAIEVESAMRSLQQSAGIYEMLMNFPQIGSVINVDRLVKNIYEANNVSNDVLYSEQETAKIQEAEQEAAAAQAQEQQMMDKLGNVDPNKKPEEGSMIDEMNKQGQL